LSTPTAWDDALHVAALFAIDPAALGGVVLCAAAGPVRDRWLDRLRALLPATMPLRRIPLHVQDERLLGGLDLAATLQAGRAVAQRGLLAEADGGVLLLAMAERVGAGTAARIAAALDAGEVATARDGVEMRHPSRVGLVALDEGGDDQRTPAALQDRLACWLDLSAIPTRELHGGAIDAADIAAARARLPAVRVDDDLVQAVCAAALALGIASMRAPLLALRVARAAAALEGRDTVATDDAALAARLVFGPRATQLPPVPPDDPPDEPADDSAAPPPPPQDTSADDSAQPAPADALEDVLLEAAAASIPAHLLEQLALGPIRSAPRGGAGAGAQQAHRHRGAPCGVRRGSPRAGQRLNVIETLRAAAPWQRLRQRAATEAGRPPRLQVRADDFHVTRFRQRSETTTIFVVDASGSAALHRLAEAKGAVELLLADCYVRRDSVAVLAFRGRQAELLLPPTRSLVRARRSLAGLPGGGGTPLASALDATLALADVVRRHGNTPLAVLLTDGRANIARDGAPGRERAETEAFAAARRVRGARLAMMLLDTSPHPQPLARRLAGEMGATYLPLPHAGAADMALAVRGATTR
jgi:magnesium chelatase subunit D